MGVYQSIAARLKAAENCVANAATSINSPKAEEQKNWQRWLRKRDDHVEAARQLARERLPSGGGWDVGTTLSVEGSSSERLVFHGSWHHMNEWGHYDGWTDHVITVTAAPLWEGGVRIEVEGTNRDDIHDYLYELFLFVEENPRSAWTGAG